MKLVASRLRRGELLVAAGGLLLLVLMFVLKWYGPRANANGHFARSSVNGWHALLHLRWLMLVTIAAALLLLVVQATRPTPAVPLTMSVIVTLLAVATFVWLGYRVLISVPPHQKVAPYVGLACVAGIVFGGYLSMREEGIGAYDERRDIPTVGLGA